MKQIIIDKLHNTAYIYSIGRSAAKKYNLYLNNTLIQAIKH